MRLPAAVVIKATICFFLEVQFKEVFLLLWQHDETLPFAFVHNHDTVLLAPLVHLTSLSLLRAFALSTSLYQLLQKDGRRDLILAFPLA